MSLKKYQRNFSNKYRTRKAGKKLIYKKLVVVLMRTTIDWLEVGKP